MPLTALAFCYYFSGSRTVEKMGSINTVLNNQIVCCVGELRSKERSHPSLETPLPVSENSTEA